MADFDKARCAFCLQDEKKFVRGSAISRLFDGEVTQGILDVLERNGIYRRAKNVADLSAFVHICTDCILRYAEVELEAQIKHSRSGMADFAPSAILAFLDRFVIGQPRAKKNLAVSVYKHYARIRMEEVSRIPSDPYREVELQKANVLLIGPTGSGKTLLVSTIAKYLDVPFVAIDATAITEAGYVGLDADHCIRRLYARSGNSVSRTERGIVYIDEIDKIASSSDSIGTRDVGGEGAQQALLKLIEGTEVEITQRNEAGVNTKITIDTSNILFVASGAFPGLSRSIADRTSKKGIGFCGSPLGKREQDISAFEVESGDLMRYGLIAEFVGRFPVIETLDSLSREDLLRVLKEPKNSLVRQYQKLFRFEGIELVIEDEVLEHIVDGALKANTGARGLQGALEKAMKDLVFEIPAKKAREPNLIYVKVSKETLYGGEPSYGYAAVEPEGHKRRARR